jgi:hypothetical protein
MKLLLLGTMLLSGGAVATNDTVQKEVTNVYNQAKIMVQKGFQGSMIDRVKETGFPYPNENFLAQLTDEQEALYLTAIDQINAEYDWQNMTDEEIIDALAVVKEELSALRVELGIEVEAVQQRAGRHWNDEFVPKGRGGSSRTPNGSYDGDCPLDDIEPIDPDADQA